MKKTNFVKLEMFKDTPDFFLSFRCNISAVYAGEIMAYIGSLPKDKVQMLKAKKKS